MLGKIMRVGWISTPLTARSGYGKVTKEVCFRLADMGYEVVNIGGRIQTVVLGEKFYVPTENGNRVLVLPAWGQVGDHATIEYYVRRYRLEAVISLYDAYVHMFGKPSVPWAMQCPIDAELTKKWLTYMLNADCIVAMCDYAYNQLLKHFPDFMIRKIEHGVDTEIFHPRSQEEKLKLREKWNIPKEAFVMLNVSANWGERKSLCQLMITFKRFLERHPDAYLYLYTNLVERCPQGYDLIGFAEELEISNHVLGPKINVILDSVDDSELSELYATADVLVHPSWAEGFGLPIIEAMACGTPVIATNTTSMTELVQGRGWLVEPVPRDVWEDVPVWIPLLSRYQVPNLNSLLECMEDAYNSPDKRLEYGKLSREYALNYDWSRIVPKWDSLIREMVESASAR